jgi:hypothetical protein
MHSVRALTTHQQRFRLPATAFLQSHITLVLEEPKSQWKACTTIRRPLFRMLLADSWFRCYIAHDQLPPEHHLPTPCNEDSLWLSASAVQVSAQAILPKLDTC